MPVFPEGALNVDTLNVPDTYVLIETPASTTINGIQTGVGGVVGTASWGPLNSGVSMGSEQDALTAFGSASLASNDMPSDLAILFTLGVPKMTGVRVSDGTDAPATGNNVTSSTGTVTIGGTPHVGDTTTIHVGAVATPYTQVAGDTTTTIIAAKIVNTLNGNLAFAAIAFAFNIGPQVNIYLDANNNALALSAAVTGVGATTTATASAAAFANGGTALGTFQALYTGEGGNDIVPTFTPTNNFNSAAPAFDLLLSRATPIQISEIFTNLPAASLGSAIATALASGQGAARGPSKLARYTAAANGNPVMVPIVMSGGTNGDASLTDSQQLGTNQLIPPTGMFALKKSGCQVFGLCGNTTSSLWTSMVNFGLQIGSAALCCFPPNMDSVTAIALRNSVGIDSYDAFFAKDWIQYLDTANNVNRLVSPMAFMMARILTLTPEQAPGNKVIPLVLGTERTIATPPVEYGDDEIGMLFDAGIMFITNPVPAGNIFGIRASKNGSSNPDVDDISYTRLTNYFAYSLVTGFGEFIEAVQTQRADDPVRKKAETKLNNFLNTNKQSGFCEAFSVDMRFGANNVNTPDSVKRGFMKAVVRIQYKSIVRFFVLTLVGGKGVDVSIQ